MSPLEHRQTPSAVGPEDRLDSWKAIAAYLGRGVRTVQRWERDEGLPVHRLAHEKRGSVYARRREVDAWWESRRRSLSSEVPTSQAPAEVSDATAAGQLRRVTWHAAATLWPVLSSDARLLAYVSDGGRDDALPQIWLQQIGGSATCITSGVCERSHLAFSADDTRIVFTASDATGSSVYSIPTLSGEPRLLKRAALGGRPSPDGKWLAYISLDEPGGIRIASMTSSAERTIARDLLDVSFVIWSPDSTHVLAYAHADPAAEPDYWIVSIDGAAVEASNTGIMQRLRQRGYFNITLPASWANDSVLFSVITPEGVRIARQALAPETFAPTGDTELLTQGGELDCFPTANAGHVAFMRTHMDQNLWSIAIDPASGRASGPLRRLTRGPGIVAHLSVARDGRTLAYFLARQTGAGPVLRDLETNSEVPFAPADDHAFPALSPSGRWLASGARQAGPRATRPIYIGSVADGVTRKLADDCGGRPRQWLDERLLVIERFGSRLNSIALLDTADGDQRDLLVSADQSVSNARVSPDGHWIAFDATTRGTSGADVPSSGLTSRPGGRPSVFVARMRTDGSIPEADWIAVDWLASHPFWSADGSLLYYLPTVPSLEFRNLVRARRFDAMSVGPLGDSFTVLTLTEMIVPAVMAGMAPIATRDRLVFVLGDFRGDVWMMKFDSDPNQLTARTLAPRRADVPRTRPRRRPTGIPRSGGSLPPSIPPRATRTRRRLPSLP
jgi:Tol biopolymer transport system component